MKKEKESLYRNALIAPISRKLLASVLDFFITLALSILLFSVFDWIGGYFPSYSSIKETTTESQTKLYQLIYDSHLSNKTTSSNFLSIEEVFQEYVYGITISSDTEENLSENETFKNYKEMNETNDRIFYYYHTYKKNNQSDYLDAEGNGYDYSYKDYTYSEYVNKVFPTSKDYFIDNNGYPLLTNEKALALRNYLTDSSYSVGKEIYDNLYIDYTNIYKEALNKDLVSSSSYQSLITSFNESKDSILYIRGSILLSGYILSTIILYIILPIILKEGRTIGFRVFGLVYVDQKNNKPNVGLLSIRSLVLLIEQMSMLAIAVFVLFGSQGVYLLTFTLWGFINIFYTSIISLVLIIVSFIFTLAFKKRKQSLSEVISLLVCKDTRDFKLPPSNTLYSSEKSEEKETIEDVEKNIEGSDKKEDDYGTGTNGSNEQ